MQLSPCRPPRDSRARLERFGRGNCVRRKRLAMVQGTWRHWSGNSNCAHHSAHQCAVPPKGDVSTAWGTVVVVLVCVCVCVCLCFALGHNVCLRSLCCRRQRPHTRRRRTQGSNSTERDPNQRLSGTRSTRSGASSVKMGRLSR